MKPRIDLDLLKEHCGGLIACSACLGGEVPKLLSAGERHPTTSQPTQQLSGQAEAMQRKRL